MSLLKRDLLPPVALFFKRTRLEMHYVLYCLKCGLPFSETNMELSQAVDNPGTDGDQPYNQVMCKRCKQKYRIHGL